MDEASKKRKQVIKIALTESIMVIAVVVIVALLMFMVMGYSLKTGGEEWAVEQSGLVQLVSTPSGASIQIDGEDIFPRTETSRMMSEGEHEIRLYREGYDDWSKKIAVKPGVFLRLKYPRLFKDNRETEAAKTFENLEWANFADNRNSILYKLKDSNTWHWLSLKNDTLTETEMNTEDIFTGTVEEIKWVGNGEKLLIKTQNGEGAEWLVIDLKTPEKSVNLTKEFGMSFTKVEPMNDSADRLWAVENGNLREVRASSKESSAVLANNVEDFANNRDEIVYTARGEDGQRTVFAYKDGYTEAVKVRAVKDAEVKVATMEYLGDTYLSLGIGRKFIGYRADDFPAEGQEFSMEKYLEQDLEAGTGEFKASDNGQFVLMGSGAQMAVMDAETEEIYEYSLPSEKHFFLDDFLVGAVTDGKLTVWDFDGTNRRELAKASGEYPAIIAVNNRWLYYFTTDGDKAVLNREQL